jgi:hypothetical protein
VVGQENNKQKTEPMLRKPAYDQYLMTDSGFSFDPTDTEVLENLVKKTIREGEEKLMLAVLRHAIQYFQKHMRARNDRGKKLFQEAEEWFLETNADWLFSFENICQTLEVDPDYIRRWLLSWKKAQLKARSIQARHARRRKFLKRRIRHTSKTA